MRELLNEIKIFNFSLKGSIKLRKLLGSLNRLCFNRSLLYQAVKDGFSAPSIDDPAAYFSAADILSCTPGMFGCSGSDQYSV